MGFLAETFRNRLEVYLKAHHPTRVLIGGLPDFLIDQIAASWCSQFHLLLVRPGADKLPANVQRCGADDLTAERQHGWAALVGMHESRGIQESIRSTGAGTVRELWVSGFPWHPCELPGARWADVRNDFIDRLGLNSILNETAICIDRFREELRGEVDASNRFFAALDSLTQSCTEYSDVCYQLGFPSHIAGRILRKRGVDNSVLALLDKFVERFKEEIVDVFRKRCDGKATNQSEKNMANHNWSKVTFLVLWYRDSTSSGEEGHNRFWNFASHHEVQHRS